MAKPSVEQLRGLPDFAENFRWDLSFIKFPNIGVYPGSEDLNIRCQTSTIPKSTNQKLKATIRNNYIYQPGVQEYDSQITLTFLETVDNTIKQMLQQWREACHNTNTGAAGAKTDVEGTILLNLLNRQDEPIWSFTMIGCFLEDFDLGTLESEGADLVRPNVTLSYDYFKDSAL